MRNLVAAKRMTLAARGIDGVTLLVLPAMLFLLALFVYPFAYGLWLSFQPKDGGPALGNYTKFFSDPFQWRTIPTTLWIALPVTLVNILAAVPVAMRVRLMKHQRVLTTILVLPITLGTVLIAQGMLNYFGPQGWFSRTAQLIGVTSGPVHIVHTYWGVFLSLVIAGFPFTFLLALSYVTGIDPALEKAAATLGASARQRFAEIYLPLLLPGLAITFCLSFVQAYSVLPSAYLVGEPSSETRVISIAASQAVLEQYDYPMASTIAIIMGVTELLIVGVALGLRGLVYRGPVGGTKG